MKIELEGTNMHSSYFKDLQLRLSGIVEEMTRNHDSLSMLCSSSE